jgi:hypothetical protein
MGKRFVSFATALVLFSIAVPASAQITAGFSLDQPPGDPIFVEYDPGELHYVLQMDLIFDPNAGPMEKHFQSPLHPTGGPILLDAQQPFAQPVWEEFVLVGGPPVSDWHEEILTPGWHWTLPGTPGVPPGSLITKNGMPWPSTPIPMPGGMDPSKIWVEFPPISPPDVLDVHKALLWVGTPGNRTWGDNVLDDGTNHDESIIRVLEYPTPEPATVLLMVGGCAALWFRRARS